MDLNIKGKTVLVSASSTGIGRATAEGFIKEGCKVAILSSNGENLKKSAEEISKSLDYEPVWVVCDINKSSEIETAVNVIKDSLGDIDILVNNCGGPTPGTFETLGETDWEKGFEQVLMSAVRFTKHVLPAMKKKSFGRIINVTSISVKQPIVSLMLSNTFRSGLTAWAKSLSNEVGKYNITVNNVAPGYTLTSRLYELAVNKAKETDESHEHVLASMAFDVPMNRLARPDEIASMIVYLASEQAGYITGQTISVDGGYIKSAY
ncbi:MAG: SDR family oxidoreductase [Melioribacteraceae bacterium]|nr:SDR family oxidoreductase [Melioribacteraceae bacterium]